MAQNTRRNHMVTHLAFNIRIGKKQKTRALNNRKREKVKSTQKRQNHTYIIDGRTYISNREEEELMRLMKSFSSSDLTKYIQ